MSTWRDACGWRWPPEVDLGAMVLGIVDPGRRDFRSGDFVDEGSDTVPEGWGTGTCGVRSSSCYPSAPCTDTRSSRRSVSEARDSGIRVLAPSIPRCSSWRMKG